MVTANYKVDESQDQIIVCSQDGHVRGYSAYDDKSSVQKATLVAVKQSESYYSKFDVVKTFVL